MQHSQTEFAQMHTSFQGSFVRNVGQRHAHFGAPIHTFRALFASFKGLYAPPGAFSHTESGKGVQAVQN